MTRLSIVFLLFGYGESFLFNLFGGGGCGAPSPCCPQPQPACPPPISSCGCGGGGGGFSQPFPSAGYAQAPSFGSYGGGGASFGGSYGSRLGPVQPSGYAEPGQFGPGFGQGATGGYVQQSFGGPSLATGPAPFVPQTPQNYAPQSQAAVPQQLAPQVAPAANQINYDAPSAQPIPAPIEPNSAITSGEESTTQAPVTAAEEKTEEKIEDYSEEEESTGHSDYEDVGPKETEQKADYSEEEETKVEPALSYSKEDSPATTASTLSSGESYDEIEEETTKKPYMERLIVHRRLLKF